MLSPKETGSFIANNSKLVTLNEEGIVSLSEKVYSGLKNGSISINGFLSHKCHPWNMPEEKAANWIFVVDTLNFCFWLMGDQKWEVTWEGKTYTGYFGLCAAINRAIEKGIDMTDPKVYSRLKLNQLTEILVGDNPYVELPLMKERLDSLHEVGQVLLEHYDGSFVNCVVESNKSAKGLLNLIVSKFPCFRDASVYKGQEVSFYKRAQILVSDIWACFEGKGLGEFKDIDSITMFADYRVPQVLVHFGVLRYSRDLFEKLKEEKILESGSDEEQEIRGCSIEAVERVNERVRRLLQERDVGRPIICNSILVDNFLWEYRRYNQAALQSVPFHRVISIYY